MKDKIKGFPKDKIQLLITIAIVGFLAFFVVKSCTNKKDSVGIVQAIENQEKLTPEVEGLKVELEAEPAEPVPETVLSDQQVSLIEVEVVPETR